jgi:hypothetical protein
VSDLLSDALSVAARGWIEDFTQKTTGSLKPWNKDTARQFSEVPVETLVRDPYFLGLEDKVYKGVMDDILTLWSMRHDPEYNIHTFIDEEAIGSGKTTKTSIIIWLLWYEVSMHLNPQDFYGLTRDSTIAFICLSRSEAQSRRVIFSDVWKRFQSPFNKEYFPPSPRMRREIYISRNNTVVYAGTSSALSALGYNLFGGVVDECNFLEVVEDSRRAAESEEKYDAAEEMYNAIINRMTSRFMRPDGKIPGLISMCSSPRYPGDFTSRLRRKAISEGPSCGIFWRRRPLWVAKGLEKYSSGDSFYIDVDKLRIVDDPEQIAKLDSSQPKMVDGIEVY